MNDVMYDPQDKPLMAKVTRGNLAVNKPERVTVNGYEAGVNGTGQPVLKLVCYPAGQPSFQEAIQITTDHLAPLMTAEQYDALGKQEMNSCDIDIELVKVAGFSLNPYRISKVLRGEIVPKQKQEKPTVETSDNVDDYLHGLPEDDRPCMNEWAVKDTLRTAFWKACREIFPDAKDIRAKVLPLLGVKDEFAIKMTVPEALAFLSQCGMNPDNQTPELEPVKTPEPPPAIEVVVKETKPVEKPTPTLTEASVIIFAKSDIYLSLPSGATVTLSVTLRDGADFSEVKRLIDVYTQMLSLPNVTTARPAPAAQPVAPAPQPAAPAPQQTASANAEIKTDVVGAIMPAMTEKGELTYKLFPRLGNGTAGKYPCYTVKATRENERIPLDAICARAGIQLAALPVGQMYMFNTPLFSISHKQGNPMKDDPTKHYRDFVSITALS